MICHNYDHANICIHFDYTVLPRPCLCQLIHSYDGKQSDEQNLDHDIKRMKGMSIHSLIALNLIVREHDRGSYVLLGLRYTISSPTLIPTLTPVIHERLPSSRYSQETNILTTNLLILDHLFSHA